MRPPRLNWRLTLEAPGRVADGAGGYVETWTALGLIWAGLEPGRGRLAASGELALSEVPVRAVVRAAPPGALSRPLAGQRLRSGERRWRILAVTEADADARYLVCEMIEESVA